VLSALKPADPGVSRPNVALARPGQGNERSRSDLARGLFHQPASGDTLVRSHHELPISPVTNTFEYVWLEQKNPKSFQIRTVNQSFAPLTPMLSIAFSRGGKMRRLGIKVVCYEIEK
jgi:hypothetical protein